MKQKHERELLQEQLKWAKKFKSKEAEVEATKRLEEISPPSKEKQELKAAEQARILANERVRVTKQATTRITQLQEKIDELKRGAEKNAAEEKKQLEKLRAREERIKAEFARIQKEEDEEIEKLEEQLVEAKADYEAAKDRVDEGLSKKVTFMAGVTEEDEDEDQDKPILTAEEVEKSLLSDPSLSFITGLSEVQGKGIVANFVKLLEAKQLVMVEEREKAEEERKQRAKERRTTVKDNRAGQQTWTTE